MQTYTRKPVVAGLFYERDPDALRSQIEWCFTHHLGPGSLPARSEEGDDSIGYIVPHAALNYSGPIAAHAYHRLSRARVETIVIVGPNHTGLGASVAVAPGGVWETPLGSLEVDEELAKFVVRESSLAELDVKAHLFEHSVEVQLPFIVYLFDSHVRIVPIVLWEQGPEAAEDVGEALVNAVERSGRRVAVIATSNLTHYQPQRVAEEIDRRIIERILSLDYKGLYDTVEKHGASMCGPGAVATLLVYASRRGARGGELLRYATSGDLTGDRSNVVGYASIRIR